MRNLFYFLFFFLALPPLKAQTNPADDKVLFLNKKNQHSISLEFLAISHTYVHQFNPKVNLGYKLQSGAGFKIPMSFKFDHYHLGIDLLELQLIYRIALNSFYFDLGPKISLNYFPINADGISYGFEFSSFYIFGKVQMGIRLDYRLYFESNEFSLTNFYFVPLVVGFNF